MTDWTVFTLATLGLTIGLLALTRRSQRALERLRVVARDGTPKLGDDTERDNDTERKNDTERVNETETEEYDDGPPRTFDHPDAVDRNFEALETPVGNAADPFADDEAGGDDPERAAERDERVGNVDVDTEGSDTSDIHAVDVDTEGSDTGDIHAVDSTDAAASPQAGRTDTADQPTTTTTLLLANVAFSQGVALSVLVGIAWWTEVPAAAFGLAGEDLAAPIVLLGALAGAALYAGNELAAALGEHVGVTASDRLRSAMGPTNAGEWALLLGVVLPVIAVFEELLFRGALIGAFAFGLGVDPWLLAAVSSVAFGLGHGAQGWLGVVVTAGLGFVLAALFVLTGSLLLVIVAHYVINALEFLIGEGLGMNPGRSIAGGE